MLTILHKRSNIITETENKPNERGDKMKTYYIYNIANDEFLGTVEASSVSEAERKASKIEEIYNKVESTDYISAFTERI